MRQKESERRTILDRTAGRCHLCGKTLCINIYDKTGGRGAWEIDHSVPVSHGGTDHSNNRVAACISCNRSKRDGSNEPIRRRNGLKKRPLSARQRGNARKQNMAAGAALGGGLGLTLGLPGAILGSLVGGAIGHELDPQ